MGGCLVRFERVDAWLGLSAWVRIILSAWVWVSLRGWMSG